jgi:hypothetical protein
VKEYFKNRDNDLLILDPSAGNAWTQLCEFLYQDVPDVEFPHANRAGDRIARKNRESAWTRKVPDRQSVKADRVRETVRRVRGVARMAFSGRREPHVNVVLHAGLYKTGTTTLQCLLFNECESLKAAGVYVPEQLARRNFAASEPFNSAHHLLYHKVNKKNQSDKARELRSQIEAAKKEAVRADCETIVFSSELFSRYQNRDIRRLENEVFHSPITVLYTIRGLHTLRESFNNQVAKSRARDHFRHGPMLAGVGDMVGARSPDRCLLQWIEMSDLAASVESVFSQLGAKIDGVEALRRIENANQANPSISWEEFWLLRTQAEKRIGRRKRYSKRERVEIGRLLRCVQDYARSMDKTPLVTMSLRDHQVLAEQNQPYVQRVAERLGRTPDEILLHGTDLERFYAERFGDRNIDSPPSPSWLDGHNRNLDQLVEREGLWHALN